MIKDYYPVKHEAALCSSEHDKVSAHKGPAIGVRNRHINVHLKYNA